MVMDTLEVVKQIYEKYLVADEAARDERVRKVGDRHRFVIDANQGVEVDLTFFDLLLRPGVAAEGSQFKHSIIVEDHSELGGW